MDALQPTMYRMTVKHQDGAIGIASVLKQPGDVEEIKTMTYDQAIQNGYKEQVEAVHNVDADYSARTDWPGKQPGEIEFTASHRWLDAHGDEWIITAYYYQEEDTIAANDGELDTLDWTAVNYEVV